MSVPRQAARSDAHDAPNPLERPFHWLAAPVPRFRLRASSSCPPRRKFYYLFKSYGLLASGALSARASRPNRRAPGSAPELIAQRMRALLGGAYRSLEAGADASAI